ncbi:MAG TPA: TetR/AcrR family transcriptional regulator [Ensifer sp.]|nr:TetR/AcrR family transcriptional regulator [Ensifer sp.]
MKADLASINPRKTPRQRRSADLVEAIYEGGARILETEGLAGLNTNRVAEVAGVSVGSLYQYFPSKEAIVAGLLRRSRQELLDGMRQVLATCEGQTFEEIVDRLLGVAAGGQFDRPNLARTLEYAEGMLAIDEETRMLKTELAEEIASFLGKHGVSRPLIAAWDLISLVRGLIDAAGLRGETDAADVQRRARYAVFGYLEKMRVAG